MMLEVAEISEEDYVREEAKVFQALRDIRARREAIAREQQAQAGEDEDTGIGIYTGYGE
jgi:hypothetical protein